ncbi:hypothetical protein DPEC_G00009820 [Dallia pectoralis]|uniref:Uncharacterized protein n=1 Tax=Dallia pectoralis TaxID=75939 RepID=A0ACC2HLX7_DALPE|nr:hypothetical protein DPEC_G00009820 [Dallia pectoralis]
MSPSSSSIPRPVQLVRLPHNSCTGWGVEEGGAVNEETTVAESGLRRKGLLYFTTSFVPSRAESVAPLLWDTAGALTHMQSHRKPAR